MNDDAWEPIAKLTKKFQIHRNTPSSVGTWQFCCCSGSRASLFSGYSSPLRNGPGVRRCGAPAHGLLTGAASWPPCFPDGAMPLVAVGCGWSARPPFSNKRPLFNSAAPPKAHLLLLSIHQIHHQRCSSPVAVPQPLTFAFSNSPQGSPRRLLSFACFFFVCVWRDLGNRKPAKHSHSSSRSKSPSNPPAFQ
jgi:hypothetical protein